MQPRLNAAFAALALFALLATPTLAQGCATGSDTFWKRDTRPVTPNGLTGVSVIQGMCEGESAGVVFEMPAGMGVQQITQVVAPWGAAGGVGGFGALLDVEVYDGVSFSGANATMGTLVWSLSQSLSSNMQVASHALNVLDTSNYDIKVGIAPPNGSPFVRRFAICFRCDINNHPTATCATGYPANFFTDNAQAGGLTCNNVITPLQTSIMEIQGQGWRDAALATVSGFQLCPLFYKGIWCIRCCSRDAYPASYTTFGAGCAGTLPVSTLAPVSMPRIGQSFLVILNNLPANVAFLMTGWSDVNSSLGSLPYDLASLGAPGCFGRVSSDAVTLLFGSGGNALSTMTLPNYPTLLGVQFYQQAFVVDAGHNQLGAVVGNAARASIGN